MMLVMAGLVCAAANRVRAASPAPESQMESWWGDLEKSEPETSRALLNFSSHPNETVAFFKHKLRPLIVDADVVEALLTQLGSDKPTEWKKAFDDLQYFDPRLAIDLPTLMDQVKDAPARQRVAELVIGLPPDALAGKTVQLSKIGSGEWYNIYVPNKGGKGGVSYAAQGDLSQLTNQAWTRAIRAEVLLEHIHTPEALAIIQNMADGHPKAQPTVVAKEILAHWAEANPVYNSK
ncbi:MAG TPA: hypothetical protein VGG19_05480 [Tepidisphaeraceae bacterium]|jgi:hypothetical protein